MKIMFLIHSLELAGAERQVVNLARGLFRKGHQASVVTFYSRGALSDELRAAGVPLQSLDKTGRGDIAGFLGRLIRMVRKERPDVLHSYLETPNILASLLKAALPKLRIVWGVRFSAKQLRHYERLERFLSVLEPKVSGWADLIIVNSYAGADDARAVGFAAKNMHVVPNGIDTDAFCADSEGRQRVRSELGIEPDERLVGRIGRFHPMKDYPAFLDAAAALGRRLPRLRFLCVGRRSPSEHAAVTAAIAQRGLQAEVIICDPRVDMRAVYSALDLLVSSSSFGEGFPNVVGEAMACGVPCVVTDVGDSARVLGIPELVVPPRQPAALEEACRRCLETPNLWSGPAARQRIVDNFSLRQLVERTEALLRAHGCPA